MRSRPTPEDAANANRPATEETQEFERALDTICAGIRDPVVKLRFIRESFDHFHRVRRRVTWIPMAVLRRAVYRWLSVERFRPMLAAGRLAPFAQSRLRRAILVGRLLALTASGLAITILAGIVATVAVVVPATLARTTTPTPQNDLRPEPRPVAAPRYDEPSAHDGAAPKSVWLVEQGKGWELYSNGLRIDTTLAVKHEARRFHVFSDEGMLPEVHEAPVGILFHTSESDVWPLEESFNENLRVSSQRLLRYIQRKRIYNYVIDRFGRVFRIVDDECKANHAGYSIWGSGGRYYLSLNNAFLGICFESRWEGSRALPITAAQFHAGRVLTECLRDRFAISPDMCVAHGIASVNPHKHLIGHHLDWARGFPFEDLGLPDQYRRPTPSVEVFGFGYDDYFVRTMGEPWPGVAMAEAALEREAQIVGCSVDDLRRRKQTLYDSWLAEQTRDEREAEAAEAQVGKGHGG
jgi:hypothetical protein